MNRKRDEGLKNLVPERQEIIESALALGGAHSVTDGIGTGHTVEGETPASQELEVGRSEFHALHRLLNKMAERFPGRDSPHHDKRQHNSDPDKEQVRVWREKDEYVEGAQHVKWVLSIRRVNTNLNMTISLSESIPRKGEGKKIKHYFNVTTNPLKLWSGQNAVGLRTRHDDIETHRRMFRTPYKWFRNLARKVQPGWEWEPESKRRISELDIVLRHYMFAIYSRTMSSMPITIEGKEREIDLCSSVLAFIGGMYGFQYTDVYATKNVWTNALNTLGIKSQTYEADDERPSGVQIQKYEDRHLMFTVTPYRKEMEAEHRGIKMERKAKKFVSSRLRIDFMAQRRYLQRKGVHSIQDLVVLAQGCGGFNALHASFGNDMMERIGLLHFVQGVWKRQEVHEYKWTDKEYTSPGMRRNDQALFQLYLDGKLTPDDMRKIKNSRLRLLRITGMDIRFSPEAHRIMKAVRCRVLVPPSVAMRMDELLFLPEEQQASELASIRREMKPYMKALPDVLKMIKPLIVYDAGKMPMHEQDRPLVITATDEAARRNK